MASNPALAALAGKLQFMFISMKYKPGTAQVLMDGALSLFIWGLRYRVDAHQGEEKPAIHFTSTKSDFIAAPNGAVRGDQRQALLAYTGEDLGSMAHALQVDIKEYAPRVLKTLDVLEEVQIPTAKEAINRALPQGACPKYDLLVRNAMIETGVLRLSVSNQSILKLLSVLPAAAEIAKGGLC